MSAFKKLRQQIEEGMTDLSQLQVNTFTGIIGGKVSPPTKQGSMGGKKVSLLDFAAVVAEAPAEIKVELVAASVIKIDGDHDLFVSQDANDELVRLHSAAVEAGMKWREAMFTFVGEFMKDLL
ncbi:MAG: hypothetical protein KKA42_00080 [candidate division Zixibacteria bacterium]|nr:hypothetical protein [candidate division Zixibacteria bacterium]